MLLRPVYPWLTLLFFLLCSSLVSSQEYKVGDKIQFERARSIYEGTITEDLGRGKIFRIEYQRDGRTRTTSLLAAQIKRKIPSGNSGDMSNAKPDDGFREWTDRKGNKLVARMIGKDGLDIMLENKEGKRINLSVSQLSFDDRTYASLNQPWKGPEGSGGGLSKLTFTTTTPNLNSVREISFDSVGWSYQPGSKGIPVLGTYSDVKIVQQAWGSSRAKIVNVAFSPDQRVIAYMASSIRQKENSAVNVADFKTGKTLRSVLLPYGNCKLAGPVFGFDSIVTYVPQGISADKNKPPGRIDVWDFGTDPKHKIGWKGYFTDVQVISKKRLVTLDRERTVQVWDIPTATAIYQFRNSTSPAISPDGKSFAVGIGESIFLCDSESGAPAGKLSGGGSYFDFNEDGTRLVSYYKDYISTWDLKTGQRQDHVHIGSRYGLDPGPYGALKSHNVKWIDDKNVLYGNALVVNLHLQTPAWYYRFAFVVKEIIGFQGGKNDDFFYLKVDRFDRSISPLHIPTEKINEFASGHEVDAMKVMSPGMTFKIETSIPIQSYFVDDIKKAVTKKLTEFGYKADPDGELTVKAFSKSGSHAHMQIYNKDRLIWSYSVETIASQKKINKSYFLRIVDKLPPEFYTLPGDKKTLGVTNLGDKF